MTDPERGDDPPTAHRESEISTADRNPLANPEG
jgi:hypothetical protein